MNKKIIAFMISICILVSGATFSNAASLNTKIKDYEEKITSSSDDDINISANYSFYTLGPAFKISKITFHNGPEEKINRIQRFLNRWKIRPLIPFIFLLFKKPITDLEFCNISFTVEFKESVEENSRFTYQTFYAEYNDTNNSIENPAWINNTAHNVTVKGFFGGFAFLRPTLLRLKPAQFVLGGLCQNITINPI